MKLAMFAVVVVAACAPAPTTPSPSGSGPAVPGALYAAPGASCRATLACYLSCEMTVKECLRTCDQRAGGDDVALAHASMSCIVHSVHSGCGARTASTSGARPS